MARCPLCGRALKWEELVEQMLELEDFREILKDRNAFMESLGDFVFKCPHCGEEFYGRNLPAREAEKVFDLLNDFTGSIDWEERRVRLKLTNLLALDLMLEEWDRRSRGG
ncbi:hypothetical protein [Thermococcus sp.]